MTAQQPSLTHLLEKTGLTFHWLNVMRGLRPLSNELFKNIEQGQIAYPFPVARMAWFALLIQDDDSNKNHSIWFLKMQLDEQGLFPPSQRDQLIGEFLETLGLNDDKDLHESIPTKKQGTSAFTWQPNDNLKAAVHAKATTLFAEPPSQWYAAVFEFIKQTTITDDWQKLGIQGFADICARLDQKNTDSILAKHLKTAHPVVVETFANGLQNTKVDHELCQVIADRLISAPIDTTPIHFYLKGIASFTQTSAQGMAADCLLTLLNTDLGKKNAFLTQIALTNWQLLEKAPLGSVYLNALIDADESGQLFQAIVADMLFIPSFRSTIMQLFRAEDRSEKLAIAVGQLFNPTPSQ